MAKYQWVIYLSVIFLVLLLCYGQIGSALYTNLGVVSLAHNRSSLSNSPELPLNTVGAFEQAIRLDSANYRAQWYLGRIDVANNNEERALVRWSLGSIPTQNFIDMGKRLQERDSLNEALLYYRGLLPHTEAHSSLRHHSGQICQRTHATPNQLSSFNSVYCKELFDENLGNLFINSQFDSNDLSGWLLRRWDGFSGEYQVDHLTGKPAPAGVIRSSKGRQPASYSQLISLKSGDVIKFSAWVKLRNIEISDVSMLHILWQTNDKQAAGTELTEVTIQDNKWQYREMTFVVPRSQNSMFRFSPVLLRGEGTVWIDDIRVEIDEKSDSLSIESTVPLRNLATNYGRSTNNTPLIRQTLIH